MRPKVSGKKNKIVNTWWHIAIQGLYAFPKLEFERNHCSAIVYSSNHTELAAHTMPAPIRSKKTISSWADASTHM